MNVNTDNLVSISEANKNFAKIARMVEEKGPVVVLKNNKPRFLIVKFSEVDSEEPASDEDVMAISRRLISRNRKAYEVLAK